MTTKQDVTRREAEAWGRFQDAVNAVPEERRETPALEAGWSAKDVVWHVAFWWRDVIRASREGWREDEASTDDVNLREQQRSRSLPMVEVLAEVDDVRRQLVAAWAEAEATDEAIEYFTSETIEHYEEHQAPLLAFAADPNVRSRGA